MMRGPTVSVVIPTCNRAHLLPRAIEAVIAQKEQDWEIVLIDDGSTDETEALAGGYSRQLGRRFRYDRQDNRGAGAARNRGIDLAQGQYVVFLDSDDEFLPDRLSRPLVLFERAPSLGFVYCDYRTVDLDGTVVESALSMHCPAARKVSRRSVGDGLYICDDLFDALIRGYFICTISGMVRRDVLGSAIRFRSDLPFGEEWLFWLDVARRCRAGFVDEALAVYHFQAGSQARTDKARNVAGYERLLMAMAERFPDMTRSQRAAVQGHRALLQRQLGCRAYRDGRFEEAGRRFAAALRHQFDLRTVWHLIQAAARRRMVGVWPAMYVAPTKEASDVR